MRWKTRRNIKSSTYHGVHNKQESYLVRKGSLRNGEPVLFFYSKNKSISPYTPHTKNMSKSNVPTSVNISIPEPENVATSKYSRDFTFTTTNGFDNDKEEKYDSFLRY